jgi:single-strand DNA-binding protein
VYGASGENVAKHMHKGRPVAIDGRLDWRKWETKDGRPAQAVRIIAQNVQFLSGAPSSNGNNGHVDDGTGALHGIATEDEALPDFADQEAIAFAAAQG